MSTNDAPLLDVDDLFVRYPVPRGLLGLLRRKPQLAVHAVDGVTLNVQAGELVALVGESGCGKTTTAQAVLRLVDPVSGSIRFRGDDITGLGMRALRPVRRRMQIVYQDPYESLDPRLRVRATVEEPLLIHGIGSKTERQSFVRDALARAGLSPPDLFLERFPHQLSGGQRQRVAIAAALVLDPQLLVADEPVSMLDVSVRAGVLRLLEELKASGLGILMITHDLSTAARFADRIAVMYLGRIVEEGPAGEVVRNPQHPYTKALLSVVPRRDPRLRRRPQILSGETPDAVRIPSGCRFHPRCPIAIDVCTTEDPSLRRPDATQSPHHRPARRRASRRGGPRPDGARAHLGRLGLKNDVLRLGAFCALGCLELDLRSLGERLEAVTNDRAVVNKKVLTLVRGGDEAIPLGVVEPLHGSSCH
jgi:peptide/nickel transport system ATP-binding protein